MSPLLDFGIRIVQLLQVASWLEAPMRFFTFIGTPDFFVFFLPVVYWCVDAGLGIRIGFILLLSNNLNEILKLALHGPRPYWISPLVKPLSAEASFGIPSGHAEVGTGVWGMIAASIRRPWAWILFAVVVFLIGLSRVYLAVHFPQDVVLGWVLGGLTLWAFLRLWDPVSAWLRRRTLAQQCLLAAGAAALLVLTDGLLVSALHGYVLPGNWLANASRAGPPYPDPLSMEGALTSAGAFFGLAVGLAWIRRRGGYRASGPIWRRTACFLVGLVGLLALYVGLNYVLPSGPTLSGSIYRFIRYAAIGAWVSAGAPLVFSTLGLAPQPDRRASRPA